LLVFAIISTPKVAVHGHCTRAQKEAIIIDCAYYILRDKLGGAPQPWSRCCRTAREVPGMDMDCIVKLLKLKDQEAFGKRIRNLEVLCVVHSPPPPHLLNIITRSWCRGMRLSSLMEFDKGDISTFANKSIQSITFMTYV
ncbi:hypothetical protein PVAP13_8KG090800, partial [Panicum virgatum]